MDEYQAMSGVRRGYRRIQLASSNEEEERGSQVGVGEEDGGIVHERHRSRSPQSAVQVQQGSKGRQESTSLDVAEKVVLAVQNKEELSGSIVLLKTMCIF